MCNESKTAASFVPEELLMPADAKHGVDGVERQELAPIRQVLLQGSALAAPINDGF